MDAVNRSAYKFILFFLALAVVLTLTGCGTKRDYGESDKAPHVMTVVDMTAGYTIYKHDTTGVWYFCVDGSYGRAVCVMVNPDGSPYTGEELPE